MVWILIGILALGNVVTYGSMIVRERIVVAGAVGAERDAQKAVCDGRVAEVARKLNEAADLRIANAEAAAQDINEAETDADLVAICQREASCRDRRTN